MTRVENGGGKHSLTSQVITSIWRWQMSHQSARTCALVTSYWCQNKINASSLNWCAAGEIILPPFCVRSVAVKMEVTRTCMLVVHTTRYSVACWISKTDIPCRSRGLGQTPVDWTTLTHWAMLPGRFWASEPACCLWAFYSAASHLHWLSGCDDILSRNFKPCP